MTKLTAGSYRVEITNERAELETGVILNSRQITKVKATRTVVGSCSFLALAGPLPSIPALSPPRLLSICIRKDVCLHSGPTQPVYLPQPH